MDLAPVCALTPPFEAGFNSNELKTTSKSPKRGKSTPKSIRSEGNGVSALSEVVRTRRRLLRLSQVELAELSGCGPAFLYHLEHDKPSLRLDKLLDVLEVLGLRLTVEQGRGRLTVKEPLS